MIRWFKLVGMRAKTTHLVERASGRSIRIPGDEMRSFNAITRAVRDRGGNAHDAAALFLIQQMQDGPASERDEAYLALSGFVVRHYHDMRYPEQVERAVLRAAELLGA